MKGLKESTLRGFFWNSIEKIIIRGIAFVIGIILARILSPSDYGLIGMLTVFIALSQVFIESGFLKALIQKKDRNEVDFSTVFFFNVVISIIIYAILFFSAPLISFFFATPKLTILLRILSLNFVIGSFNVVQRAQLLISMDFKTSAKINFIATIVSGITGIVLAYCGKGVWALVYQTLTFTLFTAIFLFVSTKWLPTNVFSFKSLQTLFAFGSKLLIAGVYSTILNNVYAIVIGKNFSSEDLGYYTRANQLSEISAGTMTEIVNSVTYPVLTSLQNDRDKLLTVYEQLLSMTAFIVFPLMILFAVLADSIIIVLLTQKWLPAASLLFWLCIARSMTPINALNMNVLNAVGRSDLFLRVEFLKLPLIIATMIITIPLGIKAIVIGSFFIALISYPINAYYPGKILGFGILKQMLGCYKIIISAIIMALIVLGVISLGKSPFMQLMLGSSVGLLSYTCLSWLLDVPQLKECIKIIKSFLLHNKDKN